ncbi:Sugar transporter STL1 [Sparassis crispa]|uniref:Sugar transporter STL1 n=1 Tax=Sparassis crispa TaxID=139825 RepID=A0A401GLE3_9APHY|nr:Sugar transporter STL1 [Sparassis crispa]GBE83001.1 Sugar transporter STL1 [Sparassis crispa]
MASPPVPTETSKPSSSDKAQYEVEVKQSSDFDAEVTANSLSLRGRKLMVALLFVAGTGFALFGYDEGVMSALLTAGQFDKVFPQVVVDSDHPSHATLQSFVVAIYEVGCLIGALSNLWIGDRLGRRHTIMLGGIIMIIGAIIQTASYSYAQLVVARIITGLGNGLNTSTVPSYHAECSPAAKRGSLIMVEGSLITFGIATSYWLDFALYWASGSSAQWRVPIAIQIIFALIMVLSIGFLPESPRWLLKHGHNAKAMAVISALEDKPPSDPTVQQTYHAIREAVEIENGVNPNVTTGDTASGTLGRGQVSLRELFTGGRSQNFRRMALGVVSQCFQQITGINVVIFYATILFQRLGLSNVNSRIVAAAMGTEYFLFSLLTIPLIDYVGRRRLMMFSASGLCIDLVLMGILGRFVNKATQTVSVVLLFVYNSIFALGWLGMTWLYPAEIAGLRIRAPANALSTASNWVFNFVVVMVTGPSFNNIGWRTYIVFAALNAFIVPVVYFFFPETAGRSLEDIDVIFALAYNEGVSPVTVSLRKDVPPAGSPEADRILGIEPVTTSTGDKANERAQGSTTNDEKMS